MLTRLILILCLAMFPLASLAEEIACDRGPVTKSFGGTRWDVFGCDDNNSMVVMARKGNPAFPFYFLVQLKDGKLGISGEGTGSQAATKPAFEELKTLTARQFNALLASTGK